MLNDQQQKEWLAKLTESYGKVILNWNPMDTLPIFPPQIQQVYNPFVVNQTVNNQTETQFEIRQLNNGTFYADLKANVTILDSDGRLFKFPEQPVYKGKFSVICLFPDEAENTIILQLDRNCSSFTVASFEIIVPPLPPPGDLLSQLLHPRPF